MTWDNDLRLDSKYKAYTYCLISSTCSVFTRDYLCAKRLYIVNLRNDFCLRLVMVLHLVCRCWPSVWCFSPSLLATWQHFCTCWIKKPISQCEFLRCLVARDWRVNQPWTAAMGLLISFVHSAQLSAKFTSNNITVLTETHFYFYFYMHVRVSTSCDDLLDIYVCKWTCWLKSYADWTFLFPNCRICNSWQ